MKRFLAYSLSLIIAASMLTSCGSGDSSSSAASTTQATTTAGTELTTISEADSEQENSASSDKSAESTADSEKEDMPRPISEMPETLKNYDKASVKFKYGMDISKIASALGNGYSSDESHLKISVEKLGGIPMVRVQTLDKEENGSNYKAAKIHFNLAELFKGHTEDLPKIYTVKADIVTKAVSAFVDENGEKMVPGNFIGKFCTQPFNGSEITWNELYTFEEEEWVSTWGSYELVMKPGNVDGATFTDTTKNQYIAIMKWSMPNQADFYIADLVFEDIDGNVIACKDFSKE